MKKIGILCYDDWMNRTKDNLMLIDGFQNSGVTAMEVPCNLEEDYSGFDAVIVRSTWGYQNDPQYYLRCLKKIESQTLLLNPYNVIQDNIDKERQLKFLKDNHIRHLDTVVINEDNLFDAEAIIKKRFNNSKIVLKPNISASGQDTIMLDCGKDNWFPNEYFRNNLANGKKVLAQKYAPEIAEGEISMVYIGEKYSHAIRRFPGVLSERKSALVINDIPDNIKMFGDEVFQKIFSRDILYTRIDLMIIEGKPTIMEIELNEPDLYLRILESTRLRTIRLFVEETMKK